MTATVAVPQMVETRCGRVECAISDTGPAVMLLHGAMGGWDQGVLLGRSALGESGYQRIAISRPGYLGTPLSGGRTPQEQADAYAAVLDRIGVRSAVVIAISGGGQSALQFALWHGDRCRALVMISACSAPIEVRLPLRFYLMKAMARFPFLVENMRKKAERDPEAASRRSIPDAGLRARTIGDPEAGPLMAALQASTFSRMAERMPGTINDIAQSRRAFSYPVERLRMPLLVVHGTQDQAVRVAQARLLAAKVPGAELMVIEGGPHSSLFTHLHEIRARVGGFLSNSIGGESRWAG
jgi:pimeloyl-ACP methyl ester carboxylesterase